MVILSKANIYFYPIIGRQEIKKCNYRKLKYVCEYDNDGRFVLLNYLSFEMLLLNEQEKCDYLAKKKNSSIYKTLIGKWFLVPEDFDDVKFCAQYEKIFENLRSKYDSSVIKNFTVITTTDCNARCFYCYEHGCTKKTMTEKTAEDVADYIIKKHGSEKVYIRWFGGEPLYNKKVIDIICEKLKESNVPYYASMTTNGYLFDEDAVRQAKELWNIERVQITLDGTEKIYNKVKNYIYKEDKSPFNTVLNNIDNLINNNIRVRIRVNVDMHNYDNISELIDFLNAKFADKSNLDIYVHKLYDSPTSQLKNRNQQDRDFIEEKLVELREKVSQIKHYDKRRVVIQRDLFRCMADNDKAVLILPDGNLSKCEHHLDDHIIGSIYSDQYNLEEISWYKRLEFVSEECLTCEFRPLCKQLSVCPERKFNCNKYEKQRIKESNTSIITKKLYIHENPTENG